MTTLPTDESVINSSSSRQAILQLWEQGLIALSAEELDKIVLGIDTSRDWGLPVNNPLEGFNPDDFDGFECN